jgi:hypothetical protein
MSDKKKKKKETPAKKYEFSNGTRVGEHNFVVESTPKQKKISQETLELISPSKNFSETLTEQSLETKETKPKNEPNKETEEDVKRRKMSLFSQMNEEIFGDKPKPIIKKENKISNLKTISEPNLKQQETNSLERTNSQPTNKKENYIFEDDLVGSSYFLLSGKKEEVSEKKINFGLIGKKLDEKSSPYLKKKLDKKEGYLYKQSSDSERAHKRYVVAEKDKKKDRVFFSMYKSEMDYKSKETPVQEFFVNEELVKDLVTFTTLKKSSTVNKKETFENCFWIIPYREEKKKFLLWGTNEKEINEWVEAFHFFLLLNN